jgi:hypothetical protein
LGADGCTKGATHLPFDTSVIFKNCKKIYMLAKHMINFPLQILATTPATAGSTHAQMLPLSTIHRLRQPNSGTSGEQKKRPNLKI